jgi:chromate transporter
LDQNPSIPYSLWQLARYFLWLGATGFGGPVALVGYMRRDLVEQRGWISDEDYREGLALAQLAPGPLAAQVAIYLGYVHYGVLGATLIGVLFVLPSFLIVVLIGAAYVAYGGLSWMQAAFYGVGACVIGLIAYNAYKLTRKTIGQDRLLWGVYLISALTTIITQTEEILLFLAAGVVVWWVKAPPKFLLRHRASMFMFPLLLAQIPTSEANFLWQIALFFSKAGAFVFGSTQGWCISMDGCLRRSFWTRWRWR